MKHGFGPTFLKSVFDPCLIRGSSSSLATAETRNAFENPESAVFSLKGAS